MAKENRYDSIAINPAALPYDLRPHGYDNAEPRYVNGSVDTFVHYSGRMQKRPGTQQWAPILANMCSKQIWEYETLPQGATGTVYRYLLMSAVTSPTDFSGNARYKLYYQPINSSHTTTAWTSVGSTRDMDASVAPHLITFSKGLAYVLGFPASSSSEKLGTVVIDGSSGSIVVRPWGVLGPQTPARITGKITKLTADASATDTTLTVSSTTGFSSPIWIGTERITYTGTTATTFTGCTRGTNGTAQQKHATNSAVLYHDWSASDHIVNVNRGWQYAYAYVSSTGQVSNRSDIESNPDFLPSNTGPFFDLIPKFTYVVDTGFDSTNYPYINIYRTTDGGGTFFLLEQIANAGPGTYTYIDDSLGTGASGTTYNDPQPDSALDSPAPSLTSNSPPTRCNPPDVTGTNTPSTAVYSIETYASRIWFGIGNYLYYSTNEEWVAGVREESFPSGDFGNFFVLNHQITGLRATSTALYVTTTHELLKLTGATKDTFSIIRIGTIGQIPSPYGITACRDTVAYISVNREVILVKDDKPVSISGPLGIDMGTLYAYPNTRVPCIAYYKDQNYELLIAGLNNYDEGLGSSSAGEWWCYDMRLSDQTGKDWWWPPWQTHSTLMAVVRDNLYNPILITGSYCQNSGASCVTYIQLSLTNTGFGFNYGNTIMRGDATAALLTNQPYASALYTGPFRNPAGNHLNAVNVPMRDTKCYGVYSTWQLSADTVTYANWTITATYDNFSTTDALTDTTTMPRIRVTNTGNGQSLDYYPIDRNCLQVSLAFTETASTNGIILYNYFLTFDPQFGAS